MGKIDESVRFFRYVEIIPLIWQLIPGAQISDLRLRGWQGWS